MNHQNQNEDDFITLKQRGKIYMESKKYMKAIKVYTQALEKESNHKTILSNRAEAFIKLGYFHSALEDCNTFLAFHNNNNTELPTQEDLNLLQKTLYRKARAIVQLAQSIEELNEAKEIMNKLTTSVSISMDIVEEKERNFKGIYNISSLQEIEKDYIKMIRSPQYFLDSLPKEIKNGNYINNKIELYSDNNSNNSSDKGIRWHAKEFIHKGELLIAEYPLVSIMNEEIIKYSSSFSKFQEMGIQSNEISFEILFTFLKDRMKFKAEYDECIKLISSLSRLKPEFHKMTIEERHNDLVQNFNKTKGNNEDSDDILKEIISNNAILTLRSNDKSITPLELAFGLYINCSFFNHSCKSNAFYYGISNFLFVKAIEDIQPNDDITISYIEPKPLYQRKNELSKWGFECNCIHCLNEKDICDHNSYLSVYEIYVKAQNMMLENNIQSYTSIETDFNVYLQDILIGHIDKLITSNIINYDLKKLRFFNFTFFKAIAVILGHIDKHKPYANFFFEKAYEMIKDISIRERYELLVQWKLLCKDILFKWRLYEIEQVIQNDYDILYKL